MELLLIVPGLLPGWDTLAGYAPPQPRAPMLRRLLARAAVTAGDGSPERALARVYGWHGDGEPPVAAITATADGLDAGTGCWLRADPVCLRPDLHGVRLYDARALALDATESRAFAEAFDRTYADDGLRLLTPAPTRWYLQLPQPPQVQLQPLATAIGRDIRPLLPSGDEARRWSARLTEVQMLFYELPANLEREARRLPIVSGLWFWGSGGRPEGLRAPSAAVHADEACARGLARLAGGAIEPLPAGFADWREGAAAGESAVVLLDALRHCEGEQDAGGWQAGVEALEAAWFAPLAQALARREIARLTLDTGAQRWSVRAGDLWKFWRRQPAAACFGG